MGFQLPPVVRAVLHTVIMTSLMLSFVCTLWPQGDSSTHDAQDTSRPREVDLPWHSFRRLQSSTAEEDSNSMIDSFAVTHECKLGATNNQTCTTKGCCLCKSRSTKGCDCEAHYESLAQDAFDKCEEYMDGAQRKCKCTQDMETAKSVAKAAVGAVLGSSMGSKIGYQVFAAVVYFVLFMRRIPQTGKPREAWASTAFVPNEMKGPYNRGEWYSDPMGCLGDVTGSIVNFALFTPRLATNWFAIGIVSTKNPQHSWFFSLLQTWFLFPCLPILMAMRRQTFRKMFEMPGDMGTDLCCSICCPFLLICQEARMIDQAQNMKTGCCGMQKVQHQAIGASQLVVNGTAQDVINAHWNSYYIGQDLSGKLVMDMENLFGENDFSVNAQGSVLLVSQGDGITFTQKTVRAAKAGAKAVIIFADEDNKEKSQSLLMNDANSPAPSIPAVYVSKAVGEQLIGMLTGGVRDSTVQIDLKLGFQVLDSLHWQQMLQCFDGNTGTVTKDFGGVLKPGMQMCAGGTLQGATLEECLQDLKTTAKWPHTFIFGPSGCKTTVPGQETMAAPN